MPELPEVETVRIQLLRKVVGKTIAKIEVFNRKSVAHDEHFENRIVGKRIADIDRVGKLMIFSFTGEDDLFLLSHFRMTGQFFYIDKKGEVAGGGHSVTATDLDLPGRHTRVAFQFTDKTTLYFNDMRLFGYVKLANAKDVEHARAGFGPEPISSDFDCVWFANKLRQRKTSIKATLLDQSFIAGLGNIYVDEALWRAQVRPTRQANKVTRVEAARLCRAAGDVMRESIAVGGTTFQHFKDTDGEKGNFIDHLKVFGQHGKVCERCGSTIKKIRVAGRGTHYCPGCQK
jgi:formamidopyrimidine-DNA glycosylase